jgi:hypothetical protein
MGWRTRPSCGAGEVPQDEAEVEDLGDVGLRHISVRQAETDEALRKAAGLSGEVLTAVEQAGRDGLPVAPVQAELDAANSRIEQARQALKSDPDKAESLADAVRGRIDRNADRVVG